MRAGSALLFLAVLAPAEDDRVAIRVRDQALQKRIHKAIDDGVAYLRRVQHEIGHWGAPATANDLKRGGGLSHRGGYTALALYALAASGVPADDPAIVRGLGWIEKYARAFEGGTGGATYANSLLVLALTRIDPKAHRDRIHRTAERIENGPRSSGFWTYTLRASTDSSKRDFGNPDRRAMNRGRAPTGQPDNSNTQFAVLALWAAQSIAGYEVRDRTWKSVLKHFRNDQQDNGGWSYTGRKSDRSTATMTAAGIVSLVYAKAALEGREEALERARKSGSVLRGWAALQRLAKGRPGRGAKGISLWNNYYWVYSMERVGTVLALDPEDWYVEGARHLVDQQGKDGGWPEARPKNTRHYETSLALLFLTRATYPPIKGAVTPPDKPRAKAAVTSKERFPDVTTERGLARGFFQYKDFKPEQRAAVLLEFGKAGPVAVGYFIEKLKDKRESVRRAALELLTKLLDKPLLFDPAAPADEREIMLAPIEAFYAARGSDLRWSAERRQFVLP